MKPLELWSGLDSPHGNRSDLPLQQTVVIGTELPGSSGAEPQSQTPISFCSPGFSLFLLLLVPHFQAQHGCGQAGFLPHLFYLISSFYPHESFPQITRDLKAHCLFQTKFILCIQNWGGIPATRALLQANYSSKKF